MSMSFSFPARTHEFWLILQSFGYVAIAMDANMPHDAGLDADIAKSCPKARPDLCVDSPARAWHRCFRSKCSFYLSLRMIALGMKTVLNI